MVSSCFIKKDGLKTVKRVKFSTPISPWNVIYVGDCENFEVSKSDPNYKSIDGMIYTKDGRMLLLIIMKMVPGCYQALKRIIHTGWFYWILIWSLWTDFRLQSR